MASTEVSFSRRLDGSTAELTLSAFAPLALFRLATEAALTIDEVELARFTCGASHTSPVLW